MKTIKIRTMTAIILFVSLFWFGCEDKEPQSSVEVNSFRVEVINDTVPSKVYVITDYLFNGKAELNYTHEGAYYSLDDTEQTNSSSLIGISDRDTEMKDTLVLFYKNAGIYNVALSINGKAYEDSFKLVE